ncbi:hypothetical protein PHLGIDRAFT_130449 [Phlebiopsis gigantea 11061_1 CR5-6]|uniref:Uncharacterized protein n=1 Tax=Phlebiopsis gigantea (strain 11061_1 CR5-6) TaxID=745531 RepID=A0A0C3S4G7_PHLG1|nr:hypothetical protein PHLGIDRAFT_130449 [Phlebiopsis gigantea 11061_1 CR5-6]
MPLLDFPTGLVLGGTAATAYFTLNPYGDVSASHELLLQLEKDLAKFDYQEGAILFGSSRRSTDRLIMSKTLPELKRQFESCMALYTDCQLEININYPHVWNFLQPGGRRLYDNISLLRAQVKSLQTDILTTSRALGSLLRS